MGEGLPIGSLTSQYFANFFLEGFDRYIMSLPETRGYVRYMDDMVWFCRSKMDAKNSLALARNFLEEEGLKIKETPQIIKKDQGITYCGYKVLPHITLLGKRKKRTFIKGIKRWQSSFERGEIDPLELQRGYAGIHGGTLPARANTFRGNVIDYLGKMEV